MSFSTLVKDELARVYPNRRCCQVAELSALSRMDGVFHLTGGSYALDISTENAPSARKAIQLFSNLFKVKCDVTTRRFLLKKANNYLVHIPPQAQLLPALKELGIFNDDMVLEYEVLPRLVKRPCCGFSYLRGAFLGGGFLSNPRGEYHFELDTENKQFASDLRALMEQLGFKAKVLSRRKNYAVYLTKADEIIRLLALVGAYSALFKVEDQRILKELRGQVNRLVNCDTANLNKAVEAALSQLKDIALIEKEVGLRSLPKGLCEIAYLRLKHSYASIRELGEAACPPLGKSAVYHRIRRLNKLADSLTQPAFSRLPKGPLRPMG